jgi:glycosyltransferase involved in cell wall biosynthesis
VKILQLGKFYDPVVGGMETALKDICEQLHPDVDFHVLVANTRYRTEHGGRNFPVTRVASLGKFFSCSVAPSFPRWVRKIDADLIHVHLPNPLAELSVLSANSEIPVVAHFHSDIVRQKGLLKFYAPFLKAFYRRATRIILPTPKHLDVSRFVSQYREKCRVVPFGISVARFDLDDEGRKKVEELRQGPPAILCVGRLVSYKGIEFLLEAMSGIRARLWLIGTGPLEDSLKEIVRKNGMSDRVQFLGNMTTAEMVAYYHACEIFVLPSITKAEMFGIVQLEAMACRKPVISTDLPTGVSWVNQHGKTGYLVPPANAGELAKSIQTLLSNPTLREEMGAAGRERVEEHFTAEKMARGVLSVYEETLMATAGTKVSARRTSAKSFRDRLTANE